MTINVGGEDITVVAETAQQLGNSRVRAICMKPTDGLIRGTEVRNLGHPLQMPVGDGVLGHVLNVLGAPLDVESPAMSKIDGYRPIHRPAPHFPDLAPKKEVLNTGLQDIDLPTPYLRGAKLRLLGGLRCGPASPQHAGNGA